MASNRFFRALFVGTSLALTAWLGSGAAQARDVNWSIGISTPGVVVDVDNGRAVRVVPAPVYLAPPPPRPVYYPAPPQPVYYAPPPRPVYYVAPPTYVAPPPAYYYRDGRRHYRHHHHDRGHRYGHDRRGDWDRR